MHINAQKDEWKTQGKTSCHYTWLLRCNLKLAASMTLSYKYFNRKQAQQKVNHCTKKKTKGKKGKGKKSKLEKPKDVGHLLVQNI